MVGSRLLCLEFGESGECGGGFGEGECGVSFVDFCGVVAYDFLDEEGWDSCFVEEGGGGVAEGVE